MARFGDNFHQVRSKLIGKQNNLKSLGTRKPKAINRTVNIGEGHLCLREENLSFNNNYNIYGLEISIINISNKAWQ